MFLAYIWWTILFMRSTLDAFPRALTQWTLMTSLGPFWFHQKNKNENKQLSYFNFKKMGRNSSSLLQFGDIFGFERESAVPWMAKAPWWMHHFLIFNLHNLSLIIWQLSEGFGIRGKGVSTAWRSKTETWVRAGQWVRCQVANFSDPVS